ncbi:potassium channel family protein [Thiofilum flexile]|uniref:potassium channel family protein n=1 Tax=Thiofilum flexile TaxID=125627 RepID=UPI000371CCD7|nr:TrkA family potassium uptake protein [Thiofilum flexile]
MARSFAIIGLGTFGSTVARELARFGNHVLGIDTDERRVSQIADHIPEAIIADATDEAAMREAGLGRYDVVVIAIGEDLEANLLCTMNARILGVKTIWVKALSRTHHRILSKLGVDRIIHPEELVGKHTAQVLHSPFIQDYVSIGNGYHIFVYEVPPETQKTLDSLSLKTRFNLRCLGVMRGTTYMNCAQDDTVLQPEDKIILLGRRADLREFSDNLQ